MTPLDIGRVAAAGRVLVGAALTVAPASGAGWVGEQSGRRPVTVFSRALGIRDAAMGVGVLTRGRLGEAAAVDHRGARGGRRGPRGHARGPRRAAGPGPAVVPFIAGGSALLGAWLLTQLD